MLVSRLMIATVRKSHRKQNRWAQKERLILPLAVVLLLTFGVACRKNVSPHPNQINAFDGATYDTLVSTQAALDEAKVQFRSGALPQNSKQVINDAGAAYEQARTSWQLWRDAVLGVKPGDPEALQAKLQTDLQQMTAAMGSLRQITGGHR